MSVNYDIIASDTLSKRISVATRIIPLHVGNH